MADFDVQIKGGTIVDGTRVPRYRGDVWIKDGKIAQLGGSAPGFAKKVSMPTALSSRPASSIYIPITTRRSAGILIARFPDGMASPRWSSATADLASLPASRISANVRC